jgi:hypothetical protein
LFSCFGASFLKAREAPSKKRKRSETARPQFWFWIKIKVNPIYLVIFLWLPPLFARIRKAPTKSYVKMTPNAYMTNEIWLDIAPSLCKGIRSMKGICDHPTWWVVSI